MHKKKQKKNYEFDYNLLPDEYYEVIEGIDFGVDDVVHYRYKFHDDCWNEDLNNFDNELVDMLIKNNVTENNLIFDFLKNQNMRLNKAGAPSLFKKSIAYLSKDTCHCLPEE